jgi:hypothetical protein
VKQEVNPVVVAIVVIVVAAAAFFFVWHKANGGAGTKSPGEVGNPGPFSPGGPLAGTNKGAPGQASNPNHSPGAPR